MRVLTQLTEWQDCCRQISGSLGVVMTMGCLHAGHASLLQRSCAENDATVLTIFVNPTQFNCTADLQNYPKTVADDLALAESLGVDYVLLPTREALYPDDYHYRVDETELSALMEGAHRPGHFTGMLTIVMKLLLLAKADRAYFGEKDYQQYQLIKGMAEAFFLNTQIIGCPTVREASGLAMSSRNRRLTAEQLALAAQLPSILQANSSDADCEASLTALGFAVDYVLTHNGRRFAAASLGDVRLIDNIAL